MRRTLSGARRAAMGSTDLRSPGSSSPVQYKVRGTCVRYSGVAHFDHLIWPTWVVILCIIRPGFGLTGCETYSCPP
jgi:hypothetical protein